MKEASRKVIRTCFLGLSCGLLERKNVTSRNDPPRRVHHYFSGPPVQDSRGRIKEAVHLCLNDVNDTENSLSAKTPKGVDG